MRATLEGELLSLEINERLNRLAVTNPSSRQLLVFNLKERKFLAAVPTLSSGIAWDGEQPVLYGFSVDGNGSNSSLNGFTFAQLPAQAMSSHILFMESNT